MSEAGINENTLQVDSDFFLNNVNHQLSMLHSSKDATLHVMYKTSIYWNNPLLMRTYTTPVNSYVSLAKPTH